MAREQLKNLTEPMYYILLTLTIPRHGYGIMQEVHKKTKGRVRIGAGTLYSLLSRFERENIIQQVAEENRRKIYQLTTKGLDILKDEYRRLNQLVIDGKDIFADGRWHNGE
jgi:DNA-binding PadR family transcriptional regulator